MLSESFWIDTPIEELSQEQWEALCDGCGKCCLHKIIDEDTDVLYQTSVACRLLDTHSCECTDYPNRKSIVEDCIKITPQNIADLTWLPDTCAYKLRFQNKPLPAWHHLNSGDKSKMHHLFHSARSIAIREIDCGDDLESHIISVIEPEIGSDEN